jgi:hypothetical protein
MIDIHLISRNFRVQTESMVFRFISAVLVIRLEQLSGKLSLES